MGWVWVPLPVALALGLAVAAGRVRDRWSLRLELRALPLDLRPREERASSMATISVRYWRLAAATSSSWVALASPSLRESWDSLEPLLAWEGGWVFGPDLSDRVSVGAGASPCAWAPA